MPSGKDVVSGRRGGSGSNKKNAFCSFCRKSYRDVGPLVEGPGDVYICGECIELCQSIASLRSIGFSFAQPRSRMALFRCSIGLIKEHGSIK